MPIPGRSLIGLALACLLAASGCTGAGPVAPARPGKKPATGKPASARPAAPASQLAALGALEKLVVQQAGQQATLTGKVKLISDRGGAIISDNGGGIISDNGGGIISDNGGGIISNNGGTIISDNGGGLVSNNGGTIISNNAGTLSKAGYGLAQAPAGPAQAKAGLAVFRLADALVTLHDARGRLLVDEAGEPLMATTDKDGGYTLQASLPPGNLVARIRLWNGGELSAMVARDGAGQLTLDLDTASTMGAAYVLGQFVKGDQAIFDKLPRRENERLTRELDAVRGYLKGAFTYDARLLTEATDALRARVPAVDRTIEDVKALLLGQARLGGGRLATEVPLASPIAIHVRKSGEILIAERFVGRIRTIDAAGHLETLMDGAFGKVKTNLPTLTEVIEGPDGALYACAFRTGLVMRLEGDKATPIAGTGRAEREALGAPLETSLVPRALAFGPDGTLYIGESRGDGQAELLPPRLLALKDGALSLVPGASWGKGNIQAVQVAPDGALYVLHQVKGAGGTLYKLQQGSLTTVADGLRCGDDSDMVRAPDGTLYVGQERGGKLLAFSPDGTQRVLTGPKGEPGSQAILAPCGLGLGPDGTLYVADQATSLVHARDAAGAWRVLAGSEAGLQQGDVTSFAINLPGGAAMDADGNLLVAEGGSHTVKRFRDGRLEIVAGSVRGGDGDGGLASEAELSSPTGIAFLDGAIWILDTGSRSLRRVAPDGTISTRAGGAINRSGTPFGQPIPLAEADVSGGVDLEFSPAGEPFWSSQRDGQVYRLTGAAGAEVVEVVLGKVGGGIAHDLEMSAVVAAPFSANPAEVMLHFPMGVAFDAKGDLYVADSVGCRILKVVAPGTPAARVEVFAGRPIAEVITLAATMGPDAAPLSEEGLDAKLSSLIVPTGLAFDAAGNLYVGEVGTQNVSAMGSLFGVRFPIDPAFFPRVPARIRRIGTDGKITTVAGPGGKYFTDARADDALALPTALTIDRAGRLVIVDSGANLIRIVPL